MKQILFAMGLSLLFLVNANAQYTPNRSTAWWEQVAPSLDNVFGSTIEDSTLTLLIIGADGDTVGIRGQFQFWRNGRYVPQDSLYTIAQIITYVTGLGYITGNESITLSGDVSGSGTTAITVTIANNSVDIGMLSATGTPSGSTFLRGDNTWATPAGSGDMTQAVYDVDSDSKADVDTADVLGLARTAAYQSKDSSLVEVTGNGKVMMGNATAGWYEATSAQAGDTILTASVLGDLGNVTESSVGDNEVLQYVTDHWENQTLAEAGIGDMNDLVDDTTPQLGGDLDWNSNGFMLVGQTVAGSNGDIVVLTSANTWSQADADTLANSAGMLGIRISASTVLTQGVYTTSGMTAAAIQYLSTTAGGMTETAPTTPTDIVRILGYAISTTEFYFDPDKTYLVNN